MARRVSIEVKGRLSIAASSRAYRIAVFSAVCRFLGSPHVYGAGTYAKAKRKEDSLKLKTNRETTRAGDPVFRQVTNNDHEALEELFARYRGRLYRTARRVLGNSNDAEDALQDGLLSAFRNLSGFKGRSQLSTWFARIVLNAALMRLRQIRTQIMTSSIDQKLNPEEQPLADRIPDPGLNPEERFARRERLRMIEQKLENLPTAYRQAVWLCDVQGMSLREAAEALGLPMGTLKSQLHRARLRLSEEVAGHHENVGPTLMIAD
jgi:RNA polymerase sigma-70 factor (ECF subfamily)